MLSKCSHFWIGTFLLASLSHLIAEKVPIVVDGLFEDWSDTEPLATDPVGDVSLGKVDFSKIWVADDGTYLFIRFTTESLVDPSDNNTMMMHIKDNSNRSITWNMGPRRGTFQDIEQNIFEYPINYTAIQFRSMPTLDANEFEVAFRLDAKPDGVTSLFQDDTIIISIEDRESGDRIPELGDGLVYQLGTNEIAEEASIGFEKKRSSDLRVVTYNVLSDNLFVPELQPGFMRQLQAVQPDVIHFQEIYNNSAEATAGLIQSWLPLGDGEEWFATKGSFLWNDTITVSRFPIISQWDLYGSTSPRGNLALLLDTKEELGTKTLMINAHPPAGGADTTRQAEVDAIMAFIRDARDPEGVLTLEENTPVVIAGDMNLVGRIDQLITFLTGDIFNNEQQGEDFAPDWDGSEFTSITPRHSDQRMGYTWRDDFDPRFNYYWPGHLDYIFYSDSVLDLVKSYVVHTPSMSLERLQLYGLEANDSLGSDHFLFVADFRPAFIDSDGNGLPDFWEQVAFGEVGTSTAMEDPDFDGSNNLEEFYAGTDPKDKNSRFAIQQYTVDESEISIRWSTIDQRVYRLQESLDLISWLGLSEQIPGTGEDLEKQIFRDQTDQLFYRIIAE